MVKRVPAYDGAKAASAAMMVVAVISVGLGFAACCYGAVNLGRASGDTAQAGLAWMTGWGWIGLGISGIASGAWAFAAGMTINMVRDIARNSHQ